MPIWLPKTTAEATGHSLTHRTITGMFWMLTGSGLQAVLKIVVISILARLLTPADFGVIGASLVVISFLEIFGKLGLAPAIVQRPDLNETHIKTGQTASIVLGCLMGLLLFALAPAMAALFHMQSLEPVVKVLALAFPLKGLATVPEALMQRQMRFREMAAINISSYVLGYATVSIALAALGFGVNALVIGILAQAALTRLSFFFLIRLPSGFSLDRTALRQLLTFGGGMTLSSLGNFFALNLDNIIVGRWLGAEALGIYSRAYQFLMQPTALIGGTIDRVLFSAMGEAQGDGARIDRAYRHSLAIVAMVTLPLSAALVILAPEVIELLLGPRWTSVIVPFQILASCLVCRTGYKPIDAVARVKGMVYRTALRQWLYAAEIATGAFIGHYWGTTGVAAGVTLAITAQYLIMIHFGRSLTSVSLTELASIHLRHLTVALLVSTAITAAKLGLLALNAPNYAVLAGGSVAGGLGFILTWLFLRRLFGDEGLWLSDQANALRLRFFGRKTAYSLRR